MTVKWMIVCNTTYVCFMKSVRDNFGEKFSRRFRSAKGVRLVDFLWIWIKAQLPAEEGKPCQK